MINNDKIKHLYVYFLKHLNGGTKQPRIIIKVESDPKVPSKKNSLTANTTDVNNNNINNNTNRLTAATTTNNNNNQVVFKTHLKEDD